MAPAGRLGKPEPGARPRRALLALERPKRPRAEVSAGLGVIRRGRIPGLAARREPKAPPSPAGEPLIRRPAPPLPVIARPTQRRPLHRALGRALACAPGLLALLGLAGCAEQPGPPPDVILIVVDTLRANRLSCYGYPRPTSPFLDQLASDGVLFEDATPQAPWTLPSMVSMMTGRYLTVARDFIGDVGPTLAESFQSSGYATLAVVANNSIVESAGFARGFDRYVLPRAGKPAEGGSKREPPIVFRNFEDLASRALAEIDADPRLKAGPARPPLFLWVHAFDPHKPYTQHAEYDEVLPVRHAANELSPWHKQILALEGPEAPLEDREWKRAGKRITVERGRYDQEVRYTDAQIGRLLGALRERGLLDRAVVAVVADHGEGLWDHRSGRPPEAVRGPDTFFYQLHGAHLYQETAATPFLLWGVGVPRGRRVSAPVQNIDLYPTLLELAGVARRGELHGASLVDLMHGRVPSVHDAVYSNALHKMFVRDVSSGLKLTVLHDDPRSRHHEPELFDLGADPLERDNLHAERPEDVEQLTARIANWSERYADGVVTEGYRDLEQEAALRELGYTGEDIGERE